MIGRAGRVTDCDCGVIEEVSCRRAELNVRAVEQENMASIQSWPRRRVTCEVYSFWKDGGRRRCMDCMEMGGISVGKPLGGLEPKRGRGCFQSRGEESVSADLDSWVGGEECLIERQSYRLIRPGPPTTPHKQPEPSKYAKYVDTTTKTLATLPPHTTGKPTPPEATNSSSPALLYSTLPYSTLCPRLSRRSTAPITTTTTSSRQRRRVRKRLGHGDGAVPAGAAEAGDYGADAAVLARGDGDGEGGDVLVEVAQALGARDGEEVGALGGDPGEDGLGRGAVEGPITTITRRLVVVVVVLPCLALALGGGEVAEGVGEAEVEGEVGRGEAGETAAVVVGGEVGG